MIEHSPHSHHFKKRPTEPFICEWCGMEGDAEDELQNTATPDGWFHDSCLDEKNIEEHDEEEEIS